MVARMFSSVLRVEHVVDVEDHARASRDRPGGNFFSARKSSCWIVSCRLRGERLRPEMLRAVVDAGPHADAAVAANTRP